MRALRQQIVSAIDFVIQLRRDKSGERIVTDIIELTGVEEAAIAIQSVFQLDNMEHAVPSGLTPKFVSTIQECGLTIPKGLFDPKAPFKLK